jgi:hypothetical protein
MRLHFKFGSMVQKSAALLQQKNCMKTAFLYKGQQGNRSSLAVYEGYF